jgi:predicted Zn-dependent protease
MLGGRPAEAVPHFAKAAALQESAFPFAKNFDPPPWWYPVRRSLAAAHLQAGDYAAAAKEANASLADWPHDGLALRVLGQAEAKQGRAAAARTHAAQARRDWRGDLSKVPVDLT